MKSLTGALLGSLASKNLIKGGFFSNGKGHVMKSRMIAGSILTGLGVVAQVLNQWCKHIFVALFYVGKGAMLEGGGSFRTTYTNIELLNISVVTRILIWFVIAGGVALILSGFLRKE